MVLNRRWVVLAVAAFAASVSAAAAQDRPFLLSVTTASHDARPALRIDYNVGAGERAFQGDTANQPEQRIGIHATRGRLTLIGRVGVSDRGSSHQSSQAGEVLVSLFDQDAGGSAWRPAAACSTKRAASTSCWRAW